MRRVCLFCLFFFVGLSLCAADAVNNKHKDKEKPKYNIGYRLTGTLGWLNRDDKIAGDKNTRGLTMDRPVVLGGMFAIEFMPTGRLESLQQWNNASIGLGLTVLDLGQNKYLGQVLAPHTYLNVPLVRRKHIVFGLRPGLGVAFVTKTYANTVPSDLRWEEYRISVAGQEKQQQIANVSVGSVVNAFLEGGVYFDFPVNKNGWNVSLSLMWQHLSNGSVMTPNGGYNMFNAEVGFFYAPTKTLNGYHFYKPRVDVPHDLWDGVNKKWDIEIGLSGGCRSVYYKDRKWFGVGSFTIAAHWIPISIFRLGAGFDLFYDGAYRSVCDQFHKEGSSAPVTYYGKTYLSESKVENCFRLGFSLQPEMVLGNFTFGYHIGFYIYDPIKNLEPFDEVAKNGGPLNRGVFYKYSLKDVSNGQDGWFYQKLQLKYHCTKYLYVQLGLKLHIMKAEFIDAGLGVRI